MGIITLFLAEVDLEQQISRLGLRTVMIASIVLIVGVIAAKIFRKNRKLKLPIFLAMAGALIISTSILFGSTIYLNNNSESGGPVHWHADIEFWACGAELELRNPTGKLSNKIGSSTYHEHNDKRIHLEGVVVKKSVDASLTKFMALSGGYIADDRMAVPLSADPSIWFASGAATDGDKQLMENFDLARNFINRGDKGPVAELINGAKCGDQTAQVQVFVYRFDKAAKTYQQSKLDRPTDYVMRDESVVPPGDCVIVEFDRPKASTDKLCRQFGIRDTERCTQFGVKEHNPELCNIREVTSGGNQ